MGKLRAQKGTGFAQRHKAKERQSQEPNPEDPQLGAKNQQAMSSLGEQRHRKEPPHALTAKGRSTQPNKPTLRWFLHKHRLGQPNVSKENVVGPGIRAQDVWGTLRGLLKPF